MAIGDFHKLEGYLAVAARDVVLFVGGGYWILEMSGADHRWAMRNLLTNVTVIGERIGFNILSVRRITPTPPRVVLWGTEPLVAEEETKH